MNIYLLMVAITLFISQVCGNIQKKWYIKRLSEGYSESAAIEVFELRGLFVKNWLVNFLFLGIISYMFLFKGGLFLLLWAGFSLFYAVASYPFFLYAYNKHLKLPLNKDYLNKFKGTSSEYIKLRTLLESNKKASYLKMTKTLWHEIASINRRRHLALSRTKELKGLEADTCKLLVAYDSPQDIAKKERTQSRLDRIYQELERTKSFIEESEKQILKAESLFLDIRTNVSLDEAEKIVTDISSLTSQIKSLEYTVDVIDC